MQIATEAIDRLHTTAESHDRVMVVEVMGRHSGWIATYAGIAGGATMVVIPEIPFDIDEHLPAAQPAATSSNRFASIVVVAEGAEPIPGTLDVERAHVRPLRPRPARRHLRRRSPARSPSAPGSRRVS